MSDNLSYSALRELSMLTKALVDGEITSAYHERRRAEILEPTQAPAQLSMKAVTKADWPQRYADMIVKAVREYTERQTNHLHDRIVALEARCGELERRLGDGEKRGAELRVAK